MDYLLSSCIIFNYLCATLNIDSVRNIVREAIRVHNGSKYDHIIDILDFSPKDFTKGYEKFTGLRGKYAFYHNEGYIIISFDILKGTVDINTHLIDSLYHKQLGTKGYPPFDKIHYDEISLIRDFRLTLLDIPDVV